MITDHHYYPVTTVKMTLNLRPLSEGILVGQSELNMALALISPKVSKDLLRVTSPQLIESAARVQLLIKMTQYYKV
jgi:hypothetical protein